MAELCQVASGVVNAKERRPLGDGRGRAVGMGRESASGPASEEANEERIDGDNAADACRYLVATKEGN